MLVKTNIFKVKAQIRNQNRQAQHLHPFFGEPPKLEIKSPGIFWVKRTA